VHWSDRQQQRQEQHQQQTQQQQAPQLPLDRAAADDTIVHNTYIPAHSKQSSMNQACSVACNACCSADVCSSARCRGFCSLYSCHVRPLTMGKYSELYVAMLYQIVLYQK